jgi:hypothetical protein
LSVLIVLIVVSSPLVCWIFGHNFKLRFLRQSYLLTQHDFWLGVCSVSLCMVRGRTMNLTLTEPV